MANKYFYCTTNKAPHTYRCGEEVVFHIFFREETYGMVLRAKGIVAGANAWLHFDYVPGEPDVREGAANITGRLCVIGCDLNEAALKELFHA